MAKISLAGFKDPVRRPRYIIWTGVAVFVLAAVMIVALGITSTRWFCIEACHKVQDDAIASYERSTHANVSCMACHMPVNANPVIFILHKAEALGELYLTVRDDYELPLNPESHVSLTMKETQCTQCHNMENRKFTPSEGIKIDHAAHAEVNAACTVCHNRIAHDESGDWESTLIDPVSKKAPEKHESFMSMTACFRCHDLEKGAAAPGACSACHPADFELKPSNHNKAEFKQAGHADMAKEMKAEAEAAAAGEGEAEEGAEAEGAEEGASLLAPEAAYASGGAEKEPVSKEQVPELIEANRAEGEEKHESIGAELPKTESIFYCTTCHREQFCMDCHGMEMPHPAEFKEPKKADDAAGHPVASVKQAKKCVMCHGDNKKTQFCDDCHHGKKAGGWEFKKDQPWTSKQHPAAVAAGGVKACTTQCHETKFCVACHTGRRVVPSSHRKANWTKPKAPGALTAYGKEAAKVTAGHSTEAQKAMESCEVCHGSGGANAKFCKSCHALEMPHPQTFKENHVSGKKTPKVCANCHLFKEVCSNCHHIGSSLKRPWTAVHGAATNKTGAANCVQTCHTKNDCVTCHTKRKAVPASHKGKNFIRDMSAKSAVHVELYKKDGEVCTYCHKGEVAELPKSKLCAGCHKLDMPHPSGFGAKGKGNGGQHQELLTSKKTTRKVCANCHTTTFCNSCHHEGAPANKPWVRYHPATVKKDGAAACFDCHDEVYCSNCHVRRAADIMGR